jgi:hypothetical protein
MKIEKQRFCFEGEVVCEARHCIPYEISRVVAELQHRRGSITIALDQVDRAA